MPFAAGSDDTVLGGQKICGPSTSKGVAQTPGSPPQDTLALACRAGRTELSTICVDNRHRTTAGVKDEVARLALTRRDRTGKQAPERIRGVIGPSPRSRSSSCLSFRLRRREWCSGNNGTANRL